MTRPTLLPVAIQGDPFASRTDYVMEVSSPLGPSPIVPTRARVTLREYTLVTLSGSMTWRVPESIEVMEHGKAPAVYGFDLVMTPPAPQPAKEEEGDDHA